MIDFGALLLFLITVGLVIIGAIMISDKAHLLKEDDQLSPKEKDGMKIGGAILVTIFGLLTLMATGPGLYATSTMKRRY